MKTMYNHAKCKSCRMEGDNARKRAEDSRDGWGASSFMGTDNRSHGAIAKRTNQRGVSK